MPLTICLITKGREQYLAQILTSFETLLDDPEIRILLIDNGADHSVMNTLNQWQKKYSNTVQLVRLDVNDSRFSMHWPAILASGADWVMFPSDDDELRPGIVSEWRRADANISNLVAFSSSAAVMDAEGVLTGEMRSPTFPISGSKVQQMAAALHEPPFPWPSLIFRVSKVPMNVPPSRFAFDWWVGINLLTAGKVVTTKSVGVNYRAHPEQESYLAPHRRKYFEASLWLSDFIESAPFIEWIGDLDDSERLEFWRAICRKTPIYGDDYFSRPLVVSLARMLMASSRSSNTARTVSTELALRNGVFLKDGESKNLTRGAQLASEHDPGNIRVSFDPRVCGEISATSKFFTGGDLGEDFRISCNHVPGRGSFIYVNCSRLIKGKDSMNADLIVSAITDYCEKRGDFELSLTGGERLAIQLLRTIKKKLPGKATDYLRRLKNSKQGKIDPLESV